MSDLDDLLLAFKAVELKKTEINELKQELKDLKDELKVFENALRAKALKLSENRKLDEFAILEDDEATA